MTDVDGKLIREESNYKKRTLNGFLWMFSGSGVQALLQIIVQLTLVRFVSPEEMGVVSASLVIIGFTIVLHQMGIGQAIIQRQSLDDTHIRTGYTLSVISGVVFGILVLGLSPLFAWIFRMDELAAVVAVLAVIFPIQGFAILSESLLQRNFQFKKIANIQVVSYLVAYGIIGICLAVSGFGVWSIVVAHVLQVTLKSVLFLRMQPYSKRFSINISAMRDLLSYGSGSTLARISNFFALQGDNLIVGRWLGPEALGLYGRAYQLMSIPSILLGQVLDKVMFTTFSKLQEDKVQLKRTFLETVRVVALCTLPLCPFFYLLAPEIIVVLLGNNWVEATVPFQILALGIFLRTNYKLSDALVQATGAVYSRARRQLVYALLVIGGSYLGQFWGIVGVAFGVLGALMVNFILMSHLSLHVLSTKWNEFLVAHLPAFVVFLPVHFGLVLTSGLIRNYNFPPVVLLVISSALTLGAYLGCILLKPRWFLGQDQQHLVSVVLRRLLGARYKKSLNYGGYDESRFH